MLQCVLFSHKRKVVAVITRDRRVILELKVEVRDRKEITLIDALMIHSGSDLVQQLQKCFSSLSSSPEPSLGFINFFLL